MDWKTSVEQYIKDDKVTESKTVVSAVLAGPTKLLDVVENLGPYLTNTETPVRVKGTKLLAEVIHDIPPEDMSSRELDVLTTFFTDRMKDHHSVTPHVLLGMSALAKSARLTPEGMAKMIRAVFGEIHLQSMAQSDRRHFYEMCQYLLHNRLKDVQERGAEFVCGFVQCTDGEKDPRNLLLAFDCVHIIAANLPLDVFGEELFEVVSCYFPIEFTPSPKDPGAISKDDLVNGLRKCLVATPKFAEFCLPLLLEKLSSSVQSAKIDSLQTLSAGASTFGPDNLKEYMASFWAAIRREVFSSLSNATVAAGLEALTAITLCLTTDVVSSGGSTLLGEFIDDIFNDTKRYLSDPDQKHMLSSASLLEASAKGSPTACNMVLELVLPLLMETFSQFTQANLRKPLLEAMLVFISVANQVSSEQVSALSKHQNSLSGIFLSMMSSDTNFLLRSHAVKGMVELTKSRTSSGEVSVFTNHLVNLSLSDPSEVVVEEANHGLSYIATSSPSVIHSEALPVLTEKLAQGDPSVFRAIAAVSVEKSIIDVTSSLLLKHLDNLNGLDNQNVSTSVSALCQNLESVMEACSKLDDVHEIAMSFLLSTVGILIRGALSETECVLNSLPCVMSLSKCARLVSAKLDIANSQQTAENVVKICLKGDLQHVNPNASGDAMPTFFPLAVAAGTRQNRLLHYFSAVICSLKYSLPITVGNTLLECLRDVVTNSHETGINVAAAKFMAGVVNRMESCPESNEIITSLKSRICNVVESDTSTEDLRERSVILYGWLTKALILRSHPLQSDWCTTLISYMGHPSPRVSQAAADGFHTILFEFEDILTPAMNADVKIMYRQRFFTMTLTRVVSEFQSADAADRSYYLTALSHLLRFAPKQVLMTELPDLVPLLMQSLLCDAPSLWLSTMNTVSDLLSDTPDILGPHVASLVTHLLRFSLYKDGMKIRIAALKCLTLLTTLPHHLVLPHQTLVTKTLGTCLDDHKRLVRREAVCARTEWFLLGAPGT